MASVICYGWGFGLAGTPDPALRVPVAVAAHLVAAVMTFPHLWLRNIRAAPVEWLWRWA